MDQSTTTRPALVLLAVCLVLAIVGSLLASSGNPASLLSPTNAATPLPAGFPDDRSYVTGHRGGRTFALRLPKRPSEPETQVIFVYTNGNAKTGISDNPRKTAELSTSMQEALEQLRHTWCTLPPTVGALRDDVPYYSFAFTCGGEWEGQQVLIPVEQIPTVLQQLGDLFAR